MYGILGTVKVSCVKVYYSRSQGGGYVDIWVSELAKICMWSEYWGGEEFKTNG